MRAILLLAGRSTRFWPLSEKTLFPVCGKTILEYQIGRLAAAGIHDVTLVGGAHNLAAAKALFPALAALEQKNLALGMRGALLDALPAIGSDPVLIVGGNDVVEPSAYAAIAARMRKGDCDGAILAKEVTRYFPGGYLTLGEGDRIAGIAEKPGAGKEPSDLVNIVAHAHGDAGRLLALLQTTPVGRDDAYERALNQLFRETRYAAVRYTGAWHPVKYPWHLLSLLEHLLATSVTKLEIHKAAFIHSSAVIEGPVVIGAGARVMPNAAIVGPCVIGERTIVANNALVRGSSIGNDCVVGFCSEVKSSVLHHHVWAHMSYIGDSVIGRNVSFGAGCATGNLRLDEAEIASAVAGEKLPTERTKFGAAIGDDCRIGIHAGINPGVKIGARSFVASGVIVPRDIEDEQFATMKGGEMVTRGNTARAPIPEDRKKYKTAIESR